ncbi:MAG: 5'-nucleotidase, lipoprotein e(P4) family [Lentimicrobiaceae bacterium]|nr:5'-nucleotidase, lipoprotein e(P4) family [Lentimicrobiaceae bacterium]
MESRANEAYKASIIWRILFLVSLLAVIVLLYRDIRRGWDGDITPPDLSQQDTLHIIDTVCGNQYMQMAVLFQQQSAEFRALSIQGFSVALEALKEDLMDKSVTRRRAIITDIDETILDNSPYQAECVLSGISYPEGWDEWCLEASAAALPGALAFCQTAIKYGVDVFYVTNRKEHLRDATRQNLLELGFPLKDDEHLIMRTASSDKEARRQEIAAKYHVSLLLGDNLNDFYGSYYHADPRRRAELTDSLSRLFGKRYIVFPNPMYGDWESALYGEQDTLDQDAKMALRNTKLQGFRQLAAPSSALQ